MRRLEHESNLGLRCPHCNYGRSLVIDSRDIPEQKSRRRRHACERCGNRFTTYEITATDYQKIRALRFSVAELDNAIAFLRAVKVQFRIERR